MYTGGMTEVKPVYPQLLSEDVMIILQYRNGLIQKGKYLAPTFEEARSCLSFKFFKCPWFKLP